MSHESKRFDSDDDPRDETLAGIPSRVLFEELRARRVRWARTRPYCMTSCESLLAGVVAGIVARTAMAPLELVKTLFQLQSTPIHARATVGYRNTAHAFATVAREEGLAALWKGNNVGCLRLGPYSGIKFMVYDQSKALLWPAEVNTLQRVALGSFAGIVATVFTYPLDVVKTRMAYQKHYSLYCGTCDALAKIWANEGMHGMFKGAVPTLIGVIPFEGVQFAVYETLKEYSLSQRWPRWRWADNKRASDTLDILVIGSVAVAAGQTVSYPFDLVRKRMQVQSHMAGLQAARYTGTLHCFSCILREEGGFLGLFKGTVPGLLHVVPYGAIIFFTYESMKSLFAWSEMTGMDRRWERFLSEKEQEHASCNSDLLHN